MRHLFTQASRYLNLTGNQANQAERHTTVEFLLWLGLAGILGACADKAPGSEGAGAGLCEAPVQVTWAAGEMHMDAPNCAGLSLVPRVLGDGDLSVDFVEVDGAWQPEVTATTDGTFRGLVLEGEHNQEGTETPVLWRQGYQSWSFSGVVELMSLTLDEDGVPDVGGDGDAAAVAFEREGTSWWMGAIGKDGGASLFVGALSALRTRFFIAADETTLWAVWGHRGDEIRLSAGETLVLDPVWLSAGANPEALYTAYGELAAVRGGVSVPEGIPLSGWATWYHFFEDITEAEVRENLTLAQALPASSSMRAFDVFQIDDGWQKVWGDWTADEGFPSGMPALAEDIAAAGFTPGLWMAPFYVDRSTDTYRDNPDWWVKDLDGEEITFLNLNTGDYAILDVTHPDAAEWLRDLITAKVAEGWTYLKLDFLYAGAEVGIRHQQVTAIEAFHQGMSIIREAAGDAWILACGAPLLPSLGYAQSFRTGADIAFGFDRIPKLDYLRWAARSTAARGWSNGLWWWIDPDQILVRPPFTDVEATGAVVANAVTGGVWMLGDDLPALSDARLGLALHDALMDMRGMRGQPRSPLAFVSGIDPGPPFEGVNPNDSVPTIWDFSDGSIALLNVSAEAIEVDAPGGLELLSGVRSGPGLRVLEPGAGEVWVP